MFAVSFARLKYLALCAAGVALVVAMNSAPLRAADDVDTLADRLDRLERDIRDLQLEVYKGATPSEDEREDRAGSKPAPGAQLGGQGNARLADMESTVRDLRGQVEQLTFLVKQLQSQAELQRNEVNYRLGALEGGAPAGSIATAPAPTGAPPLATTRPVAPTGGPGGPTPLAQQGPGGSQAGGAKPGSLGTMPATTAPGVPAPAGDPRAQYDAAMELLSRAQYSEAQAAFRSFVQANPTNELAGPAQYWVGDIAFTQKDYGNAAKAFADVLKRFAKTTKAPDAMLKLGLSLMELGQKAEGCTTLGAVKAKYPNANASILSRAAQRFKEAKCT